MRPGQGAMRHTGVGGLEGKTLTSYLGFIPMVEKWASSVCEIALPCSLLIISVTPAHGSQLAQILTDRWE